MFLTQDDYKGHKVNDPTCDTDHQNPTRHYQVITVYFPTDRHYYNAFLKVARGTHPASYTVGTRSFPGVKWPGRGVNEHPPPSSAEVKERV